VQPWLQLRCFTTSLIGNANQGGLAEDYMSRATRVSSLLVRRPYNTGELTIGLVLVYGENSNNGRTADNISDAGQPIWSYAGQPRVAVHKAQITIRYLLCGSALRLSSDSVRRYPWQTAGSRGRFEVGIRGGVTESSAPGHDHKCYPRQ
jgi:hypothetical protein